MDIYKLETLSEEDRKAVLESETLEIEEQVYMKPLTPEELAIEKDELSKNSIMKAVIDDEFQEVKAKFKEKLKPVSIEIKKNINAIKNKAIETKGPVHKIPDYDNRMIHMVTPEGRVLNSRAMLPQERQYFLRPDTQKEAI